MSILPPIPQLTGSRLRLRAVAAHDVDALFALHSDTRVMRYWSHPPWTDRSQAADRIEQLAHERGTTELYAWAATLDRDDTLIGTCSLFALQRAHARCDIGYALSPDYWGRGYASEMISLALDHAFERLDLRRIEADIDPRNTASCRLVERAGFQREGLLRERWRVGGEVQDTALYGLLRGNYRPRAST
jgi:ribosomal-protein-alanine N-acetyltransferase